MEYGIFLDISISIFIIFLNIISDTIKLTKAKIPNTVSELTEIPNGNKTMINNIKETTTAIPKYMNHQ